MASKIDVSSTSGASNNDDGLAVVEGSTDQPVSDKERESDSYVWITVLGKEIGKENGVTKVKQLAIWNYVRHKIVPEADEVRQFHMFFIGQDGNRIQLDINGGGLGASRSPIGGILNFTGPDSNLTISNDTSAIDDRRYLRVRRVGAQGRSLNTNRRVNDNSYFSISRFPEETFINVKIQVVERPRLYFRYMSDRNIVITDIFRQEEEASYIFELASLSDCKVHFVDSTECK